MTLAKIVSAAKTKQIFMQISEPRDKYWFNHSGYLKSTNLYPLNRDHFLAEDWILTKEYAN